MTEPESFFIILSLCHLFIYNFLNYDFSSSNYVVSDGRVVIEKRHVAVVPQFEVRPAVAGTNA